MNNQKNLNKLLKTWNKKLKDSGFDDIEQKNGTMTKSISQNYMDNEKYNKDINLNSQIREMRSHASDFYFETNWQEYKEQLKQLKKEQRISISVTKARQVFACWLAGVDVRRASKYTGIAKYKNYIAVIQFLLDLFTKSRFYDSSWDKNASLNSIQSSKYKNKNCFHTCKKCGREYVLEEDNMTEHYCSRHKKLINDETYYA